MTGRSLHDALLRVLIDGPLRARLLAGHPPDFAKISQEEWEILLALPAPRLVGLARFLARHYYRERLTRLFRYPRLLAPLTGRDPCRLLDGSALLPILDIAVLGSLETADRLLEQVWQYLTADDDDIRAQVPFWRDLIRYHATLFRIEAQPTALVGAAQPMTAPSTRVLVFTWDLPTLFRQLQPAHLTACPQATPTMLMITRKRTGEVVTARCDEAVQRLLEATDGQRDRETLAEVTGLPRDRIEVLLRQLAELGAVI